MSGLLGLKSVKRVQRISRRILSKHFVRRLHEIYFCSWDFTDNSVRADQTMVSLVPSIEAAIRSRLETETSSTLETAFSGTAPALPLGQTLRGVSWATFTSLTSPHGLAAVLRKDESRPAASLMDQLNSTMKN
mgnify:CR=1 FL=1